MIGRKEACLLNALERSYTTLAPTLLGYAPDIVFLFDFAKEN